MHSMLAVYEPFLQVSMKSILCMDLDITLTLHSLFNVSTWRALSGLLV